MYVIGTLQPCELVQVIYIYIIFVLYLLHLFFLCACEIPFCLVSFPVCATSLLELDQWEQSSPKNLINSETKHYYIFMFSSTMGKARINRSRRNYLFILFRFCHYLNVLKNMST